MRLLDPSGRQRTTSSKQFACLSNINLPSAHKNLCVCKQTKHKKASATLFSCLPPLVAAASASASVLFARSSKTFTQATFFFFFSLSLFGHHTLTRIEEKSERLSCHLLLLLAFQLFSLSLFFRHRPPSAQQRIKQQHRVCCWTNLSPSSFA